MAKQYKIGIVGATGAVGYELIRLLVDRAFPAGDIRLFASARSAGREIRYKDFSGIVEVALPEIFDGLDVAIFSAGGDISRTLAPEAVKRGCTVIDNSSAFRMDPDVPLVIPEINPESLNQHKGLIANPNCSTAIALIAIYPLHREFGLRRFFASTYQAVSGTGAEAIRELEQQVKAYVDGRPIERRVYPHQIAFNLIPHVDSFLPDGYTKEEMKMCNEARKILGLPNLRVSTTCVRVPVIRSHSISIFAEFERPVSVDRARVVIGTFPGAELIDNPSEKVYPMPLNCTEKEKCGVGRIRKDVGLDNGLALWVVGDQLWKGAALNAIQIAEILHERSAVRAKVAIG